MRKWIFLVVISIIFILSISEIEAVPYQYNITPLTFTWSTTPNTGIVALDTNQNGYADQIYTWIQSGQNLTFHRLFGNLDTIGTVAIPAGQALTNVNGEKDQIFVASFQVTGGTTYNGAIGTFNVTSGTTANSTLTHSYVSTSITHRGTVGMLGKNNENMLGFVVNAGTSLVRMVNTTGTVASISQVNSMPNWDIYGNVICGGNNGATLYGCIDNNYIVYSGFAGGWSNNVNALVGNCGYTNCISNSGGTGRIIDSTVNPPAFSFAGIDPYIQSYNWGLNMPTGKGLHTIKSTWGEYAETTELNYKQFLAKLDPEILDPTLTNVNPIRFVYDNGTSSYLFYLTSTGAKYTSITNNPLVDRASSVYMLDTNPPTMNSGSPLTPLTAHTYTINTPTTETVETNTALVSIPSGYGITPSSTTARLFEPRVTNDTVAIPAIIGSTVSQTTLTFIVKNAPTDSAIDIKDKYTFNSVPYSWTQDYVKADKSYSVDLPNAKCIDVYLKDLSSEESPYENLGNLCASGSMPKSLVYTTNLSFTFFSLPYGVSHTFNQPTTDLTTKVRHNTLPYNYTIQIYNSTGTLAFDQDYYEAVSTTDLQSINTTGISLPALMRVYDVDGNQLYYTTLGSAGYLSQTVAWFNEWLTIEGFNLLFMLPIVFGAMFTRNTVGIGTMSTVMLIATLSWFGVIPVPDVAIYLMIFVAVVGVIAYKKLYD